MRSAWNKNKILVPIYNCPVCNKPFKAYINNGKRQQFCSRSCSKTGVYSPMWKGDEVGILPVHAWIKRRLSKPNGCKDCKEITNKLDLANISQEYKRDLSDWEWLCRKCHMLKDGRLENTKKTQFKKGQKIRLGSKHSIKTKQIISKKVKKLWENPEYRQQRLQ